jgi:hypothetical protein
MAMNRAIRSTVFVALLTVAALGMTVTAAGAQERIQPNQHFIGLINGSNAAPVVVYTVCPGPIGPGRTGPVAGGQTMSVAHVANGGGYTGLFSQVYSWFNQDSGGPRPNMLKFTEYGVSQTLPSAVRVPCGGTGQATFSSCPYLAPCAAGFIPDVVTVEFVDIAV